MSSLVTLYCYNDDDDALIAQLPLHPNLYDLRIGAAVTNAGVLQGVACNLPKLFSLDMSGCFKVTDKGLFGIAESCPKLRNINLTNCTGVTTDGIEALASKCMLYEFILCGTRTTDQTVAVLAHSCAHQLHVLRMSHCEQVGDESMRALGLSCPELFEIDVSNTTVTDAGLHYLAKGCPQLIQVEANSTNITDVGIKALVQERRNIMHLSLNDTRVTDEGLVQISENCAELHSLQLVNCMNVTDTGVKALGTACPKLVEMDLRGTNVGDDGVKHLLKNCTSLQTLDLTGCVHVKNEKLGAFFRK